MGKPVVGNFVKYPETSDVAPRTQSQAVKQLLHLYKAGQEKKGFPSLWGDEIEAALISFDKSNRRVRLIPKQRGVLQKLDKATNGDDTTSCEAKSVQDLHEGRKAGYTSEFASYMVESEPHAPYEVTVRSLLKVETNMAQRRKTVDRQLQPNERLFTLAIFPRLGAVTYPTDQISPGDAKPDFTSREARFQAADMNINGRRERPVDVNVPLYLDSKTLVCTNRTQHPYPFYINPQTKSIQLDTMLFGPGHCGFQVTFQTDDESEARYLHDQLIPLGPIMLALTASTPIYRGYLADTDVRWNQIADAVDDRPLHEVQTNGNTKNSSSSSSAPPPRRWSANETYISSSPRLKPSYQRSNLPINSDAKRTLEAAGMDATLARHFAHTLIREPLIISEADAAGPRTPSPDDHAYFESLDGTIWPHVKLKLPPHDDERIGWRVEFRAMETQLTDFENCAFAVFMLLVRLAVTRYRVNWYVPIGLVQENMERAHPRDAVREGRFWFRRAGGDEDGEGEPALMSVDEVVNGSREFLGLMPLVERFIQETGFDAERPGALKPYLDLVKGRASGKLLTAARWMREFVLAHPEYEKDSWVSDGICFDIMTEVEKILEGERKTGLYCQTD